MLDQLPEVNLVTFRISVAWKRTTSFEADGVADSDSAKGLQHSGVELAPELRNRNKSHTGWWSPPTKLGVPKLFDLLSDPKEEYGATLTPNGWAGGPMMKIVAEFERSVKLHALIAPGTPDPYQPPAAR